MDTNVVKELSVKKHGHIFTVTVLDSGRIECCIDNGGSFSVKQLKDGAVYFINGQELVVRGELMEINSLVLDEVDFVELKEAQDAVLLKKQEESMRAAKELRKVDEKDVLSCVDEWKHKVCTYKDKNNVKQKYCVHSFRIGNNKYRFLERDIAGAGVIINPDYKVSDELPDVGGVPKQYGELMFWDYCFEDGWRRVRALSYNELICLEVVRKYGYFTPAKAKVKEGKFKKGVR